jgi:proteasome lid subunit RPN8/RPN11
MSKKQGAVPSAKAVVVSAEPAVKIDSEVTRRIRQHARAYFKTEVCGVLIGESTDEAIDIRASIEALNAAQAGTHVTFTQDAWEEIYKVKDEQYPDARIVGWYHSHPGFGIFLSEHDLFIQENFFSSLGQVAWVYDPHSDDEGCFGWVGGKVARLTSVATLYQSGEPVEHAANNHGSTATDDQDEDPSAGSARASTREAMPAWVRWSQAVLTHLTVLLAGFALAYFLFPRLLAIVPSPTTGDVMVVDYSELRAFFKGTGPMPKPVDVVSVPGLAAPASSAPIASPSATPPAAQPAAPAATQPAKPEGKK